MIKKEGYDFMELEYTKVGDYYIPNLIAPNMKDFKIGKYGRMRLRYLKENKKAEYTVLLIENKLQEHLMEVDNTANTRFELLMKQFAEKENITEELKATNQMEWVGKMNTIKNAVEEYIEYYNNRRIKSKLKGMSPVQYRKHSCLVA